MVSTLTSVLYVCLQHKYWWFFKFKFLHFAPLNVGPTLNPHTTHGCHWVIRKLRCFFPVTKGRDISEFDQVTTVTKVDSVLSVNRWQYPNHLAQFTRLLPYLHCRLNVNLHRIVIITKKPQNDWCNIFWSKVHLSFHKHCWKRVEVEFTRMTNNKCCR